MQEPMGQVYPEPMPSLLEPRTTLCSVCCGFWNFLLMFTSMACVVLILSSQKQTTTPHPFCQRNDKEVTV